MSAPKSMRDLIANEVTELVSGFGVDVPRVAIKEAMERPRLRSGEAGRRGDVTRTGHVCA